MTIERFLGCNLISILLHVHVQLITVHVVTGASWQYDYSLIDISLLVLEFRVHRLVELQKHVLAFKVITTLCNCIILVL